jgi:hypothetical protein
MSRRRLAWTAVATVLTVLWAAAVMWRVRRVLGSDVAWPLVILSFACLAALGLGVVGGAWERAASHSQARRDHHS